MKDRLADVRVDETTGSHRRLRPRRRTRSADQEGWHPLWLKQPTLLGFMMLFLSLAAGLGAIKYIDARDQGFPLSLTDNHYSWEYGPTVVLICVVGLWRQVNYCAMTNQPWQELSKNSPQDAASTVLLDYMWPLQARSFWTSLKRRHFAVSATILVFALFKLIIIISTTLFLLGESIVSQKVPLSLDSRFDSALFWNSTPPVSYIFNDEHVSWHILGGREFTTPSISYQNISADPVWAYMNLSNEYSSDPPVDLSTAFTSFSLQSQVPSQGIQLSAEVDVFQPNATCEVAELDWPEGIIKRDVDLTFRTASCDVGQFKFPVCSLGICEERVVYFLVERVNCTGDGPGQLVLLDEKTPNTYQYAMIVAEMDSITMTAVAGESEPTSTTAGPGIPTPVGSEESEDRPEELGPPGNGINNLVWEGRAVRITAVSCNLTYAIRRGTARASGPNMTQVHALEMSDDPAEKGSIVDHVSSLQLSEAVLSSLQTSWDIFDHTSMIPNTMGAHTLLGLISGLTASGSSVQDFEPLFDGANLQHKTQDVLDGISQQVMRHFFLLPYHDNQTLTSEGSMQYSEPKLRIRPLALWTMLGLFVTCAFLVVIVMLCVKRGVAPQSPTVLATSACTLASSPDMVHLLNGLAGARESQIQEKLAGWSFSAVPLGRAAFRIEANENVLPRAGSFIQKVIKAFKAMIPRSKKIVWPYSARRHIIVITLSLPLICIAALEILWHRSETDVNFINPRSDSSVVVYAVRYTSTAIVLIVGTLYTSMDFTIATLTPFSALASRGENGAPGEHTLLFSMVANLPPVALYKAIRHGHIGASLSLVASTIGSLLPIAASGLWVLNNSIPLSQAATAQMQTGWRIDFEAPGTLDNYTFKSGATIFNDIQHGSRDAGALILDNVVLPDIRVESLKRGNVLSSVLEGPDSNAALDRYVFPMPAVQPALECSAIPSSSISLVTPPFEGPQPTYVPPVLTAAISVPEGCELDPDNEEMTFDAYTGDWRERVWFGFMKDLSVRPTSGSNRGPSSEGCPSLGFMFGRYDFENDDYRVHSYTCTQRLRAVEANVTYHYASHDTATPMPNLTIPLQLADGSENLVDPRSNVSSSSLPVASHFNTRMTGFLAERLQAFDNFFEHLILGPEGVSSYETMLDNDDALLKAVKTLYQKFMTHVIDVDFRMPLGGDLEGVQPISNGGLVQGTLTESVLRLKMNDISKIILEAFLGAMVLLGGLAWWLVRIRGVVYQSPYPIANAMALFGGSRLLREFDGQEGRIQNYVGEQRGAEGHLLAVSGRNVAKVVTGRYFRLGWWDGKTVKDSPAAGSEDAALMSNKRFGIDLVEETT